MRTSTLLQFQLSITGVAIVTTTSPAHVPTGVVLLHGRRDALEFLDRLRDKTDSEALGAALETITLTPHLLDSSTQQNYHVPRALLELFLKLLRTGMRVCCEKRCLPTPLEAISTRAIPPLLQCASVIRERGRRAGGTALVLYRDVHDEPCVTILSRRHDAASFLHECVRHLSPADRKGLVDSLEWLPARGPKPYFVDSYTAALLHVGAIARQSQRTKRPLQ